MSASQLIHGPTRPHHPYHNLRSFTPKYSDMDRVEDFHPSPSPASFTGCDVSIISEAITTGKPCDVSPCPIIAPCPASKY